ncbi:SigE family RNA polymerase sigma factor [Embleya sp. NPDC001921]
MNDQLEQQFRDFMVSRWPRLLRTAYTLTGNHHDAEELAQGTLARVYIKWDRVRRSDHMDNYVWQMMFHHNTDRLRRRRVREWFTNRPPESSTSDTTLRFEDRRVIMDALTRLPVRQRAAIALCYLDDMSHEQAAEVLGTRPSTIRSQVTRGLAKLRGDATLTGLIGGSGDTDRRQEPDTLKRPTRT